MFPGQTGGMPMEYAQLIHMLSQHMAMGGSNPSSGVGGSGQPNILSALTAQRQQMQSGMQGGLGQPMGNSGNQYAQAHQQQVMDAHNMANQLAQRLAVGRMAGMGSAPMGSAPMGGGAMSAMGMRGY